MKARFKCAIEEQVDELDFYNDLIDTGVTVEMVAQALGKEVADHMCNFCKEHGLL